MRLRTLGLDMSDRSVITLNRDNSALNQQGDDHFGNRNFSSDTRFVVVLARDRSYLSEKIRELERIGIPFLVICGQKVDHPRVRYRKAIGKWNAINYATTLVPPEVRLIILNDVDTEIHGLQHALTYANQFDVVFCKVRVETGPQTKFYRILDPLRTKFPIAASGELMLISRRLFNKITPIPPCIAEDSFIMFRVLELGHRVKFCTETYVITTRTRTSAEETAYKLRTTLGIYQSLGLARPSPLIRFFYFFLPMFAPILGLAGSDGWAWVKGIEMAAVKNIIKDYPSKF